MLDLPHTSRLRSIQHTLCQDNMRARASSVRVCMRMHWRLHARMRVCKSAHAHAALWVQAPMSLPIKWKDDRLLQPRHVNDAATSVLFYEVLPRKLEQHEAMHELTVRPSAQLFIGPCAEGQLLAIAVACQ